MGYILGWVPDMYMIILMLSGQLRACCGPALSGRIYLASVLILL